MQNPFPGMNPYLEDPRHWRDVHTTLIVELRRLLVRALPPEYAARTEERVYIEAIERDYIADNVVLQVAPHLPRFNAGGTAVLERPQTQIQTQDDPFVIELETRRVRERFIEIRTVGDAEDLIAVIEVLSPGNKTPGAGRNEYQQKQRDLLQSQVHLVEIDLLRGGEYTIAPPKNRIEERFGPFDYAVSLHEAHSSSVAVWPRTVRDRLPRIGIPLTEDTDPIYVDLQEVLNRTYEESGFSRLINYQKSPDPPLSEADTAWAEELLHNAGLK